MPQRLLVMFGAAVVGAIFAAGLFLQGRVGGALLLVTAAILGTLTRLSWTRVRPQGRPLRLVVIVAVIVIGVIKLIRG